MNIASMIDHTLLKADATIEEIKKSVMKLKNINLNLFVLILVIPSL